MDIQSTKRQLDISYVAADGIPIKFLSKITSRFLPKITSSITDFVNTSGAATISPFVLEEGNSTDHVQDQITHSNQPKPNDHIQLMSCLQLF